MDYMYLELARKAIKWMECVFTCLLEELILQSTNFTNTEERILLLRLQESLHVVVACPRGSSGCELDR